MLYIGVGAAARRLAWTLGMVVDRAEDGVPAVADGNMTVAQPRLD